LNIYTVNQKNRIVGGDIMYKKYSKKELKDIINKLNPMIYICEECIREEFKQIKINGEYTKYLISSFGRVINSETLKELRPSRRKNGYLQVQLGNYHNKDMHYKPWLLVHRLVAIHFIKNNSKSKTQVNHCDGVKTNNHVWNLEWVTPKENIIHAYRAGLITPRRGEDVPTHKFGKKDVIKVCKMLENNISIKKISKKTGISRDMVRAIYKKRAWAEIVSSYDFPNYNYGKNKKDMDSNIQSVNEACKMLESNSFTMKQISDSTGLGYGILVKIKNGEIYKDISKNYNISNYSRSTKNKTK
jgi:hypothetical protein